jgi:hypothetical protein
VNKRRVNNYPKAFRQMAVERMRGDPKDLVLHFSQKGVTFGIHSSPIPIVALRQEIERKRGIYCVFFDTDCFRREDAAARARDGAAPLSAPHYSFRERLARSSSRHLEIGGGLVTVLLSPDVEFPPVHVISCP